MISLSTRTAFARTLLVASVVWLASVTLCSTKTVAAAAVQQSDQAPVVGCCSESGSPGTAPAQGERRDQVCGCKIFKVFLADSSAMAKPAALVGGPALYRLPPEEFTFESAALEIVSQNTGPPGCWLPAELILRCGHFSQAPPLMA